MGEKEQAETGLDARVTENMAAERQMRERPGILI